jgi:hypothetical protein
VWIVKGKTQRSAQASPERFPAMLSQFQADGFELLILSNDRRNLVQRRGWYIRQWKGSKLPASVAKVLQLA